jgi:hypothetical protein
MNRHIHGSHPHSSHTSHTTAPSILIYLKMCMEASMSVSSVLSEMQGLVLQCGCVAENRSDTRLQHFITTFTHIIAIFHCRRPANEPTKQETAKTQHSRSLKHGLRSPSPKPKLQERAQQQSGAAGSRKRLRTQLTLVIPVAVTDDSQQDCTLRRPSLRLFRAAEESEGSSCPPVKRQATQLQPMR